LKIETKIIEMAFTEAEEVARNDHFAVRPLSRIQEALFIIVVCSAQGTVLGSLAQGILPDKAIGKSFGASSEDISWFPAAYGLTTGTTVNSFR
jgi:hypothetical protein